MGRDDEREAFEDRTLEVWQPRTSRQLTAEDAREIAENVVGFFRVLLDWAAAETCPGTDVEAVSGAASHPTPLRRHARHLTSKEVHP